MRIEIKDNNEILHVEKGEKLPFICPVCNRFIEYDNKVQFVTCVKCKYFGVKEEFMGGEYKKP